VKSLGGFAALGTDYIKRVIGLSGGRVHGSTGPLCGVRRGMPQVLVEVFEKTLFLA
jgi:hypothetical protein